MFARRLLMFLSMSVFIFSAAEPASAQGEREPDLALSSPMPVDPALIRGRLENGFSYFIKRNVKPAGRAEFRLVVNAGSVLEDDDQQGLAHLVEHMAFNGSRNFRKQELVNYLESIGMRFGPETNAYTSFDETVYMLEIPLERAGALDKGLTILEDWASGLALEDSEIDRERGVVLEEWRLGQGAETRLRDKQYPVLLSGSRYAERLPIGKPETIRSAPPDALRRFYRDWYRPDLTALVAVGDFDPESLEKTIRERFGRLANPASPRPRPAPGVPGHAAPLVTIATDPELPSASLVLYRKVEPDRLRAVADYRRVLVESLARSMLSGRLDELERRPDSPFLSAYFGKTPLVRARAAWYAGAGVEDGKLEAGLAALVRELKRAGLHGFGLGELERAKKDVLSAAERRRREAEKIDSGDFAARLVRLFLSEGAFAAPDQAELLARRYLPEISLAEVNAAAGAFLDPADNVLMVSAPARMQAGLPPAERLLSVLAAVAAESPEAWQDQAASGPLVSAPPARGGLQRVESPRAAALGAVEWKLSNGARVILKTTDFKNDELVLTAWSAGGSSLVADQDYLSSQFAPDLVEVSGAGDFSRTQLDKFNAGKTLRLSFRIDDYEEGLSGFSSRADLETFFQLIYLHFTRPRYDEQAVSAWLNQVRMSLRNRENHPEEKYANAVKELVSGGHFRGRPLRESMLAELDARRAVELFRERFADAGDFTFVFAGSIKPEELEPHLVQWLAALPGSDRPEQARDDGQRYPKGRLESTLKAGLADKSLVTVYETGPFAGGWLEERRLDWAMQYLDIRLRELIREERGGSYNVSIAADVSRRPVGQYSIELSFGAAPGRIDELVAVAVAEIERNGREPPASAELEKVRQAELRGYEKLLRENGFWLRALKSVYRDSVEPAAILEYPRAVMQMSGESIREVIHGHWTGANRIKATLKPAD